MLVTITTDASFCPIIKKASFAFCIACDEIKIRRSGLLRKNVKCSSQAEFKCIVNALYVMATSVNGNIDRIIVNTDSMNCIHIFNKDKAMIKRWGLSSWGYNYMSGFKKIIKQYNINPSIIELRHVKAHSGTDTARQWTNEWCDQQAKNELRTYRNKKAST